MSSSHVLSQGGWGNTALCPVPFSIERKSGDAFPDRQEPWWTSAVVTGDA